MTAADVVTAFIGAIEAKDLDAAVGLVAEDCEYDNVPMGKVHGPQQVRERLARVIDLSDEVEWVIVRQVGDEKTVFNERIDRFRIGDKLVELPLAGVFEVVDGKITLWRDYFDLATYRDQMA